jgi:hypothetical protein
MVVYELHFTKTSAAVSQIKSFFFEPKCNKTYTTCDYQFAVVVYFVDLFK